MPSTDSSRLSETPARVRDIARAAALLVVPVVGLLLLDLGLALQTGTWQLFAAAAVLLALAVVMLGIATAGHPSSADRAAGRLIGGILLAGVLLSGLLAGVGLACGLFMLLATVALAAHTLPLRMVNRAVMVGVLAAMLSSTLDLLALPIQAIVPQLQAVMPILLVVFLAVYGLLVAFQFRAYPLSIKLIISFLTVTVLSVGAVSWFTARTARAGLLEDVNASLKSLTGSQAVLIGDLLVRQINALGAFGLSQAVQEQVVAAGDAFLRGPADLPSHAVDVGARAALEQLDQQWKAAYAASNSQDALVDARLTNELATALRAFRTSFPDFVEIFVTDRFGGLVAATDFVPVYAYAGDSRWRAITNQARDAVIGQPRWDASHGTFVLDLALPVQAPASSDVVGVLHASHNLDTLIQMLVRAGGKEGRADILLPGGLLFRSEGGLVPLDLETQIKLQNLAGQSYVELTYDGEARLVSPALIVSPEPEDASIIADLGWMLLIHQHPADILAPIEMQTRNAVLIAVVIAGIMAGVAVVVGHSLAGPIVRLTHVAQQIAAGDLAAQARVESRDEIGELANTFNAMTAQWRELVGSLEQRVAARTEQLRAGAHVGRATTSILDPQHLLREVVDLITSRFGFYYAAIFTLDPPGRFAVLREATGPGDIGRVLKERGHKLEVGGRSMVGYATAQRQPRIALDVGQEPVRFANSLLPDTHSEIVLPLIVGERVIGALDVQSTQPAAFDETSAAVLQSMADQIAIALNNAEQFRHAERQAKAQANLLAAVLELTGQAERDTMLDMIGQGAVDLLEADGAGIWLSVDDNEIELVAAAGAGSTRLIGRRLGKGVGMSGTAFATGRALRVDDYSRWPDRTPALEGALFHSALSVPLIWQGRTVGVLSVTHSRPGKSFSADDERAAHLFAAQAAAAIENARLAEEQRQTLHDLDAANRRLTGEAWTRQFERLPHGIQSIQFARHGQTAVDQDWLPHVELAVESTKPVAWSQREAQNTASPFQAVLAAPIMLRGDVIGALQVGEAYRPRAWSADDLAFLQSVADQVALAVENVRLIEETQRTAYREKALAGAADKVRRCADMEVILQVAAEELAGHLNASRVAVRMGVTDEGIEPGSGHEP